MASRAVASEGRKRDLSFPGSHRCHPPGAGVVSAICTSHFCQMSEHNSPTCEMQEIGSLGTSPACGACWSLRGNDMCSWMPVRMFPRTTLNSVCLRPSLLTVLETWQLHTQHPAHWLAHNLRTLFGHVLFLLCAE